MAHEDAGTATGGERVLRAGAGRSGEGAGAWLAASGLLVCGFLAVAWLALSPKPGQPVAAVFPPWWGAGRAFAAVASAGGRVVRAGAWAGLVVVVPEAGAQAGAQAGLGGRLVAAGAWLIVDPRSLGGCGAPVPETR